MADCGSGCKIIICIYSFVFCKISFYILRHFILFVFRKMIVFIQTYFSIICILKVDYFHSKTLIFFLCCESFPISNVEADDTFSIFTVVVFNIFIVCEAFFILQTLLIVIRIKIPPKLRIQLFAKIFLSFKECCLSSKPIIMIGLLDIQYDSIISRYLHVFKSLKVFET